MKFKNTLAAVCVIATSGMAHATTVSFGGVENLGVATGAGTAEDFYNYQTSGALKGTFNGAFADALELGTAYMFLYEESDALSLGMVFTGANVADPKTTCNEAAGGDKSLCRVAFSGTISGLSSGSTVTVKDDAANSFGDEDASDVGANGFYSLYPFTGTTDGFVTRGVVPNMPVVFDVTDYVNIDTAYWVSGPEGALTYTAVDLGSGGALIVTTPLPAGVVLLLSAIGMGGLVRAKQKRAAQT